MKKINKLLKLVPALAVVGTIVPMISLTACNNGASTSTYTVTYGSTPAGLTFSSKPTSVKKGEDLVVTYKVSNGYELNTVSSIVKSGNTDITSNCSLAATTLTVPAASITGNLTINLYTETVTAADYTVSYPTTPSGLTWTTKPTSASKNKSVTITYSLSSGYSINTTTSKITVGGTDVTSQIGTYNSGSITIPASLVTGNISISLTTKQSSTYSVTYSTTPTGLTWVKNPSSATDGAMFTATYTLVGYMIDTTNSSITIGETEQKDNLTYANGTIVIPASMVTGKIIISLATVTEASTGSVTSPDSTATIKTSSGKSVTTVQTITPNTAANADEVNVTLTGTLLSTQILIDDSVATKAYTYNITLDNCCISNVASTVKKSEQPFLISKNENYKSTFNIILKDGSENAFNDRRSEPGDDGFSNDVCFQSKSLGDINIKGNGTLSINNVNGYKGGTICKGIQTKGNLTISDSATVNVFAYDTAIQVGGILTIDSGYVGADSYNDDAIKTKFEDPADDLALAGAGSIKRDIIIKGTSVVKAYAARTGINAAHDIIVSGAPTIDVYTTSTYANDGATRVNPSDKLDEQNVYVAIPSSLIKYTDIENYYYTLDLYNTEESAYESEVMTLKKIRKDNGYYFFKSDRPLDSNYLKFRISKYAIDQYGAASPIATAQTGELTISSPTSTSYSDCVTVTSISGSTIKTSGSSFDCNYYKLKENDSQASQKIDTVISSKGFKAKNDISISSGTINIKSGDTCMSASYGDIYCKSATAGAVEFGTGDITISGGAITCTSNEGDGIKGYGEMNISGGSTTVTKSVEALEAGEINISGGNTVLSASDDGLNASQTGKYNTSMVGLNISGGILDVQTTTTNDTDAIDSNNTLTVTGGLIIARVPGSSPSSSFDWESGSVTVKNATIILMGESERGQTLTGGTTYSASGINTFGNHTVTYYTSSSSTSSYTFNNNQKMNSTFIIRSTLGQPTFK